MSLEKKFIEALDEQKIYDKRGTLLRILKFIKEKCDETTSNHSMRLSLKGKAAGELIENNPSLHRYLAIDKEYDERVGEHFNPAKALFFSGTIHDLGKASIEDYSSKNKNFGKKEMKEMKNHPIEGYILAKADFPFSAGVCYEHHRYRWMPQDRDLGIGLGIYPTNSVIPSLKVDKITKRRIKGCAKIISLLDCYDALTHRDNSRHYKLNGQKAKNELLKFNKNYPQRVHLINSLL